MVFNLTEEQAKILEVAKLGHNIFFTGEAGTGKTFLIGAIVEWLRKSNKTFTVMCSRRKLCVYSMPGELHIYDYEESGNIFGISSSAMKRLILKPNCNVMLVWNLNDDLKNGSCRIFEAVDGKL